MNQISSVPEVYVTTLIRVLMCVTFSSLPVCLTVAGNDSGSAPAPGFESGIVSGSHLLPPWPAIRAASNILHRSPATTPVTGWNFSVGSTHDWYAWDFGQNAAYLVPSTCRAVGTCCYVFTEDVGWAAGKVTQAGVDAVVQAWDKKVNAFRSEGVYSTVVRSFGDPSDVDGDPRIVILLLDIRDSGLSGFEAVTGYFDPNNLLPTSTQPTSNEAEMFYVDVDPLDLSTDSGIEKGARVLAHELQHLIHLVHDEHEVTFINEMCSMSAELLCGFSPRIPEPYVHATNFRLTIWRSPWDPAIAVDYSRAERFGAYLVDQFGETLFPPLVATPATATVGIDSALAAISAGRTFDELFVDWTVANILADPAIDPRYGYVNFAQLPPPDAVVHTEPTVAPEVRVVRPLSVEYHSYLSGSSLRANFYSQGLSVRFKAVELGPAGKRVLDVPNGQDFVEPDFGRGYTTIHFLAINLSPKAIDNYIYESSGEPPVEVAREGSEVPEVSTAMENYPNPFNPTTVVSYQLPVAGAVQLVVYDILGRALAVLEEGRREAGTHAVRFDGSGLTSGVYVCRLTVRPLNSPRVAPSTQTRSMLLLR